jgi:hypothetical protein
MVIQYYYGCYIINCQLKNFRVFSCRHILGSFFLFPALGSGSNSVSIYAENRINVERSIRLLNYLVSPPLSPLSFLTKYSPINNKSIGIHNRPPIYMRHHSTLSKRRQQIHSFLAYLAVHPKN